MKNERPLPRRRFLKQAASVVGAATASASWSGAAKAASPTDPKTLSAIRAEDPTPHVYYPRSFSGEKLKMISFPLGGVAAGSIGLGGRGQLRDWEIFNRPNKGSRPSYAFPSIWAQAEGGEPVARVLESRILPPYEGQNGLGASNAPGLSRLETSVFTGEYPLAHIDFEDGTLPVKVELDAFSPFIPHEPDDSGLPVAVLRYRVTNPGSLAASVGIAFSIDNPVIDAEDKRGAAAQKGNGGRVNEYRTDTRFVGLAMSNPTPGPTHINGSFLLYAKRGEAVRRGYGQSPEVFF